MADQISEHERQLIDAFLDGSPIGVAKPAPLRRSDVVARRKDRAISLARQGIGLLEIPETLFDEGFGSVTVNTIRRYLTDAGIKTPRRRGQDVVHIIREDRAARKIDRLNKARDRRRFKTGPVPVGEYGKRASKDACGTLFPAKVSVPTVDSNVLTDGASSSKIGGDVLVGRLEGAHIVTLTLEERVTCPRSCEHWRGCYMNQMPFATRWVHGPALVDALRRQIPELLDRHGTILVRLHIGGEFYSADYARFWQDMVITHPGLNVFGFTAYGPDTEIGEIIARARMALGRRFAIRHSSRGGPWGSFVIPFDYPDKTFADAIVCPEQLDARTARSGRHCGNCAICWSTDRPVAFVRH